MLNETKALLNMIKTARQDPNVQKRLRVLLSRRPAVQPAPVVQMVQNHDPALMQHHNVPLVHHHHDPMVQQHAVPQENDTFINELGQAFRVLN